MSVDIPPPPSNPCHHCKHEMLTCARCVANRMCCHCNPTAMKTELDDTAGSLIIKTEHNDKLTIDSHPSLCHSPLPETAPRPNTHRHHHRRDFHSALPFAGNFASLPGFCHPNDATIEPVIDTNNAYRFMSRGHVTVPMIQNAIERLLSTTTSWQTVGLLVADIFKDFTIVGNEDDIDHALISICGVSEDAIMCFTNLLDTEASQQAYEADMANYDDQLSDWQMAATMRESFLIDVEKTISSLENQLNHALARITDLHQQEEYRADPNALTHLQAMLQAAKLKSNNDKQKIKELTAEKVALEAQVKALQAAKPHPLTNPLSLPPWLTNKTKSIGLLEPMMLPSLHKPPLPPSPTCPSQMSSKLLSRPHKPLDHHQNPKTSAQAPNPLTNPHSKSLALNTSQRPLLLTSLDPPKPKLML